MDKKLLSIEKKTKLINIILQTLFPDKTPISSHTLGVKGPKIFLRCTLPTEKDSLSFQFTDVQSMVHGTSDVEGKDAQLCRVSDSTEPINDPADVGRSSPRRSDPVPSPYLR